MDLDLNDRVYVVLDEASGLGLATAECLVSEGARVVVAIRDEHALQGTALDMHDSAIVSVVANSADIGAPQGIVAAAHDAWGRLDGALVSLSGRTEGRATGVTDEEWATAFEFEFMPGVRLCRDIAQALPSGGSLALVLSSGVHEPVAERAVATSFQRGLASVALQLAEELGPRGIRVNGLLPGGAVAGDPDHGRTMPVDAIPMGRHGTPEEFGRVATFVLSPAASYISGSIIPVDGGMQRSL